MDTDSVVFKVENGVCSQGRLTCPQGEGVPNRVCHRLPAPYTCSMYSSSKPFPWSGSSER